MSVPTATCRSALSCTAAFLRWPEANNLNARASLPKAGTFRTSFRICSTSIFSAVMARARFCLNTRSSLAVDKSMCTRDARSGGERCRIGRLHPHRQNWHVLLFVVISLLTAAAQRAGLTSGRRLTAKLLIRCHFEAVVRIDPHKRARVLKTTWLSCPQVVDPDAQCSREWIKRDSETA